jgi:CheY-like chemotaxis protein
MLSESPKMTRHVIVVDDEELFTRFAAIPFRSGFCGHCAWEVHAFTDQDQALGYYRVNRADIDVLLTDYYMPGRNGVEIIHAFRQAGFSRDGHELTAIVMSSDPPAEGELPRSCALVKKPFTRDDIAEALCRVSSVCVTGVCRRADGTAKPLPGSGL